MIVSNERELQLKVYSDFLQPLKRKSIDVDMEIESLFKNLAISDQSSKYHGKKIYYDSRTNQFCFEYDYEFEGLRSIGCSQRVKLMFQNMKIPMKKSFRYILRMMNKYHNVSRVNSIHYIDNF